MLLVQTEKLMSRTDEKGSNPPKTVNLGAMHVLVMSKKFHNAFVHPQYFEGGDPQVRSMLCAQQENEWIVL